MEHRIELIAARKLVGKRLLMSFTKNLTGVLWQSFMPYRDLIEAQVSTSLYSLQDYGPDFFVQFSPDRIFEKWAAVEVSDFGHVPDGMETMTIAPGMYAVFQYKGSSGQSGAFKYIFNTWMPSSGYELDDRPHFEILGEKYRNNDAGSEEEIWIPIREPSLRS